MLEGVRYPLGQTALELAVVRGWAKEVRRAPSLTTHTQPPEEEKRSKRVDAGWSVGWLGSSPFVVAVATPRPAAGTI